MSGRRRKLVVAASAACVIALAVVVLRWPVGPSVLVLNGRSAVRWELVRPPTGFWRLEPHQLPLREVIEVRPRVLGTSVRATALIPYGDYPAISPDGTKVALVHGGSEARVYSLTGRELLLGFAAAATDEPTEPAVQVTEVAWDCSGDRLTYVTSFAVPHPSGKARIHSVREDGQMTFWSEIPGTVADAISWCPTGDRSALYYHLYPSSLRTVCIVDRHRGALARGPKGRRAVLYPTWHPHGERLALFMEETGTGRTGCWEIDAATGENRLLSQRPVIPLAYRPGGQELVVVQLDADQMIAGFGLLDRQTGSVRTVVGLPGKMATTALMCTSSPDRRYAAVVGYQEPDMFPIYLLDLDTFTLRAIRSGRIRDPYDIRIVSRAQ